MKKFLLKSLMLFSFGSILFLGCCRDQECDGVEKETIKESVQENENEIDKTKDKEDAYFEIQKQDTRESSLEDNQDDKGLIQHLIGENSEESIIVDPTEDQE